jgi:hypothetical protein
VRVLGRGRMKAAASTGDALYFRVGSDRQTTEPIQRASSHRAQGQPSTRLGQRSGQSGRCILTETRPTHQVSEVDPAMPPNP